MAFGNALKVDGHNYFFFHPIVNVKGYLHLKFGEKCAVYSAFTNEPGLDTQLFNKH